MSTITALRRKRPGAVAVELDGSPWRTLPDDVVVATRLRVGLALDRPRLRELRRALRQHEATSAAARLLQWRDRSTAELEERLRQRGLTSDVRGEAIESLRSAGLVDDRRFALSRAGSLAERGRGNEAIRHDLGRYGVPPELVGEALDALEPEEKRAVRVAHGLGGGIRAARALVQRGFAPESVEAALGSSIAEQP